METTKPRKGLLIPGAIIFGIFYGISLLSIDQHGSLMAIPIAGPFIETAQADDCISSFDSSSFDEFDQEHCHDAGDDTVGTWIGVSQVIGASLFGLAWAFPVTVRTRVAVAPAAVPGGQGLSVTGTF